MKTKRSYTDSCFSSPRLILPRLLFLLVLIPFLFSGCMDLRQPYSKVTYYTLEYDAPDFPELHPTTATLSIRRFTAAPSFKDAAIVYSEKPYMMDSYIYHRWHAPPDKLVRYFLSRDLQDSGLFLAVLPDTSAHQADYQVSGNVDAFLEQDLPDWHAKLSVTITLTSSKSGIHPEGIILQEQFSISKQCDRRTPQAVARAMSEAMADISAKITRRIYEEIEDRKKN